MDLMIWIKLQSKTNQFKLYAHVYKKYLNAAAAAAASQLLSAQETIITSPTFQSSFCLNDVTHLYCNYASKWTVRIDAAE